MKSIYTVLVALCVFSVCFTLNSNVIYSETKQTAATAMISPNVVISQFFGGGGSSGAPYANDFVELFNRGNAPVSLNGWSVQYASSGGTNWLVTPLPNITLQPGQYFLIQYASNGSVGNALPTPDLVAPPVTSNGSTFTPNLSSTTGKIALVNSTATLPVSTCPADTSIVDLVGYGDSASCFEGAKTANLTVSSAGIRNGGGCTDTDNNRLDFTITVPTPRNTSNSPNSCNLGGTLQASGAANPTLAAPGGTTLLTVTVIAATSPASTGVTVVGNLTSIGGAANQQFYDDGTNGDVTAGDNIFSYLATIPAGTSGGVYNVSVNVSDAQARTATVSINISVNAPLANEDPLLLGNPSNATGDVANENNYLMIKPQYSLSYNRSRASANWVAWRLDTSWIGTVDRQDDFRPDPDLPTGWYQVTPADYTGSGYDRGHMTPSGDRTRSAVDNSATFLMTNILPQLPANNQGPWNDFENYCRTVAQAGNELYIVSGGAGNIGTIGQGRIVVPKVTWKVALVLPNGSNDLQRVSKATRTIAIIVPNQQPLSSNTPWRNFRVSVDAVEALTGYNFFSNVPKSRRN